MTTAHPLSGLARRPLAAAFAALTLLSCLLPGSALAARPIVPARGERFMTQAEVAAAIDQMSPRERASIAPILRGPNALPIAYVARTFDVVEEPDGTFRLEETGFVTSSPAGTLSVPSAAVAAYSDIARYDLRISLSVIRTRSSSPYEWRIAPYAEWSGSDGMNGINRSEDSFAVAWNGGMWLHSDRYHGLTRAACTSRPQALEMYRSDVANNLGVGYSFREWKRCNSFQYNPMWYGYADVRVRQRRLTGDDANVSMKYFHTYGGLEYSLGFSASGPSISISPSREQWPIATYVTISR